MFINLLHIISIKHVVQFNSSDLNIVQSNVKVYFDEVACLPSGIANRTTGFEGLTKGTSHLK